MKTDPKLTGATMFTFGWANINTVTLNLPDPTNKKYPIDTPEHVRAAWSYGFGTARLGKTLIANLFSTTQIAIFVMNVLCMDKM